MPSREEQFDQWYDKASAEELMRAATDDLRQKLEDNFQGSDEYNAALESYHFGHVDEFSDSDDFIERLWYDESADTTDEDEDEASEEADDEAKEDADLGKDD